MKKEMSELELSNANFLKLEAEVEAKRVELQAKLKKQVYSYMISVGENDWAIAYIQEPHRLTKMRVLDMLAMQQGMSEAGQILLESSLIQEESDKRILNENPENDALFLTMITNCIELIKVYSEVLKKK